MAKLQIQLFGTFEVTLDHQPLNDLRTDKVRALLAYLVIESQRSHPREALAELLWPEQSPDAALHNLRQALSTLRKALGDDNSEAAKSYLLIRKDSIQWNTDSDFHADVLEFTSLVQKTGTDGHINIRIIQRALQLYRAPLLEHFTLADSTSWEEWALLTRENCNRQAVQSLDTLITYHERRREYPQAAALAERLLRLAPWDENLHASLMRLHALQGNWSAALAQYAACRRMLKSELDVEPTSATTALFEQIRRGAAANQPPVPRFTPTPNNLPIPSSPFSGRERELNDLAELIADPRCRLITLLGPGGIGKTRLALEAAREQVGIFADGVYYIPLSAVNACDQLPTAIAAGMNLVLLPREDAQVQVLRALQNKSVLLLLDTLEHLPGGALCLAEILKQSPHLVILATSRARLNLQEEWVYLVEGLQTPPREIQDLPGLLGYNAVELFLNAARRVGYHNQLDKTECAALGEICRMVEGTPLSLELAASTSRVRSLVEIASDLTHSIDILASELVNVPARHRSLRATFEHSWALLSPTEQSALACLSVFRGQFSAEAGTCVSQASPQTLHNLVEKFLVKHSGPQQFWLHDMLRQFAAEKYGLAAAEQDAAARHCIYYADFLKQREPLLESFQQEQVLQEIGMYIDNAIQAWRVSVEGRKISCLSRSLAALFLFFDLRSRYNEGISLFAEAVEQLPENEPLRAAILAREAVLHNRLGQQEASLQRLLTAWEFIQHTEQAEEKAFCLTWIANITRKSKSQSKAREWINQALTIARDAGLERGISSALYILAAIVSNSGEYALSIQYLQESLQVARALNNPRLVMAPLNLMADLHCYEGNYQQALDIYEECLEISRQLNDRYNQSMYFNNLGTVYHYLEKYDRAAALYQQSLEMCREIGDENGTSIALSNLGEISLLEKNYPQAERYFLQGLELAHKTGDVWSILASLNNLGIALMHLGQMEKARQVFLDGLKQAKQAELAQRVCQSLVLLGLWLEKANQPARACLLARVALADEVLEDGMRSQAIEIIERSGDLNGKTLPSTAEMVERILSGEILPSL